MKQSIKIKEYTTVDLEFAKRAPVLWDVAISYLNKQVDTVNLLGRDLFAILNRERGGGWVCDSEWSFEPEFPKFRTGGNAECPPLPERFYFCHDIHLKKKLKGNRKIGFRFWAYADTRRIGWYAGQWDSTRDSNLLDPEFLLELDRTLTTPNKGNGGHSVYVPEMRKPDEGEDPLNRYIHLWCYTHKSFDREVVIKYHNTFKSQIVHPIIKHLRQRRVL